MTSTTFLALFLLILLALSTRSFAEECRFTDFCSGDEIYAEVNQTFTDTCDKEYRVLEGCTLSRRCCYEDFCSDERICSEDGVLEDSCGAVFDIAQNCELSEKEENDGAGMDEDDEETDMQDVGPETTTEKTTAPTPERSTFFTEPTITPTPEVPATTPSQSPSQSPSPSVQSTNEDDAATSVSSEAVCIHTQHLSHLAPSALLFPQHVLAHVLCDTSASCATPGHMVVYRGEAMTMNGYCRIVGCRTERAFVNSPRYSRGGRVESRTTGLMFTMLAARFETRFEEIVLAGLVRVGL